MIICLYHGTIELYLTSNLKFASESVSQCKMQVYLLATTKISCHLSIQKMSPFDELLMIVLLIVIISAVNLYADKIL